MCRFKSWILAAVIAACSHSHAQAQLAGIKAGLTSEMDTARYNAVSQLYRAASEGEPFRSRIIHARMADRVRGRDSIDVVLIKLLEKENHRVAKPNERFDEEYTDYYANLIGCVAALHDVRAVDALVGAIGTGAMAWDGLAALGEPAVKQVIMVARSPSYNARHVAMMTLDRLLAASSVSEIARASIRETFITGLRDNSESVKIAAIKVARHFDDAEVRSLIKKMASTDPTRRGMDGKMAYPVRVAALKWLGEHPAKDER